MPLHDWTRADEATFHYFHQAWMIEISYALNTGLLPPDFFALAEQSVSGPIPDVITLQSLPRTTSHGSRPSTGLAIADAPPPARFVIQADEDIYAMKASQIKIKHRLGRVVAVIEIVSPGNKSGKDALRTFVSKTEELLRNVIHLLIVDVFPPSSRDPQGIHQAIWERIDDEPFELPADKPLTAAAYRAGQPKTAYVEPIAVGDVLPSLPIFLDDKTHVPAPLEQTYQTTWNKCPQIVRDIVMGSNA